MRTRPARKGDGVGEREGKIGGGLSRHRATIVGRRRGVAETRQANKAPRRRIPACRACRWATGLPDLAAQASTGRRGPVLPCPEQARLGRSRAPVASPRTLP
jgi:hypothetical protein